MSLAALKAKIAAEVRNTPSPTRAELAWRTVMGTTLGIAIAAIIFGGGAGPTLGGRAPTFVWGIAGVLAVIGLRAWLATVSARAWPSAAKRLAVLPYVALAAIAVTYTTSPPLAHHLAGDIPCLAKTMVLSAIVGVATMIARRGTEPIQPSVKALLLGSFAATVGGAMVFLACPLEQPVHFLIGHLGGALVIGVTLALVATKVIGTK